MFAAVLWAGAAFAFAAGGAYTIKADVNLDDQHSLQRGARLFTNYCLSCHSAAYMRFSRMAEDLELSEEVVTENLMFATDKIGSTMQVALKPADAKEWFGVAPPDLSVIARSRGADWLNTFFLTFYVDESKPTGMNNLAYPDTAMPHVLWELQGLQHLVHSEAEESDAHGAAAPSFKLEHPGAMDEREYRRSVRDLVNFLVYIGEPSKLVRYKIGNRVIMFLILFTVIAYLLKREFWKDIH